MTNRTNQIEARLAEIEARVSEIYESTTIELRSSYISNFDSTGDAVTFERIDSETGDTLKYYEVTLLDTDEPEVEWNTDNDGGYGCWNRLNREVKAICRELYSLLAEKDNLEEELEADDELPPPPATITVEAEQADDCLDNDEQMPRDQFYAIKNRIQEIYSAERVVDGKSCKHFEFACEGDYDTLRVKFDDETGGVYRVTVEDGRAVEMTYTSPDYASRDPYGLMAVRCDLIPPSIAALCVELVSLYVELDQIESEPIRHTITLKVKTTDPMVECTAENPPLPSIDETPEPVDMLNNLRVSVRSFRDYEAADIENFSVDGFEATCELLATWENNSGQQSYSIEIPVIVYPERTYPANATKSGRIVSNANTYALRNTVAEWLDVERSDGFPIVTHGLDEKLGKAIESALLFAELPELEARRHCFAQIAHLEELYTLNEIDEDDYDQMREWLDDAFSANEDDYDAAVDQYRETIANANDRFIGYSAAMGKHWGSSPIFDGDDYDTFRERLDESINETFIEIMTATPMVSGEFYPDANCVKAVITCGGPYVAIHQFFGETPRVVYRSWGGPNYETPLHGFALDMWETMINEYFGC